MKNRLQFPRKNAPLKGTYCLLHLSNILVGLEQNFRDWKPAKNTFFQNVPGNDKRRVARIIVLLLPPPVTRRHLPPVTCHPPPATRRKVLSLKNVACFSCLKAAHRCGRARGEVIPRERNQQELALFLRNLKSVLNLLISQHQLGREVLL